MAQSVFVHLTQSRRTHTHTYMGKKDDVRSSTTTTVLSFEERPRTPSTVAMSMHIGH